MIVELLAAGMSQQAIADAIGLDQSGVSRMANAEHYRVRYEVGAALQVLYRKNARRMRLASELGSVVPK